MSGSLNKVMLIGNLGKDPELKMSQAGQAMCRFSLATTETWKDKAGEKQSKTEWHNIVIWGKLAEVAEKYLHKGKQIMVEGRIQYREYKDDSGVDRKVTDIRCDNFVMLGRMDEGGSAKPKKNEPTSGDDGYEPGGDSGGTTGDFDSDIPF